MSLTAKKYFWMRAAPYARLIKRVVLGPGSPGSASYRQEILCPEEKQTTRPPIYLSGQLDRLTGATEHLSLEVEIASMLAKEYTHAATIAYHIKDAVLLDGSVYSGNLRHFLADHAAIASDAEARHFESAGLASTSVGCRYFGHWLHDDCIQYLLAEQTGTPICVGDPPWKHRQQYASYFEQDWTPTDRAYVEDLVVYQDFGQNSLKRQRYKMLAKKIATKFSSSEERGELVYLRRGSTGLSRVIQDDPAISETLAQFGFTIIDANGDLDLILQNLTQAKLVVSIEGSHIAHCCYSLEENCGLIVLQPSDRFTAVHRHWTQCVGINFGFVVGTPGEHGYRFSTDEILRTADMMLKRIELLSSAPLTA
jgi:Glycosyltransferase 61